MTLYPKQESSLIIHDSSKILQKSFLFLPIIIERSNLNLTIKNTECFDTFYKQYLKCTTDYRDPEGIKFVIQLCLNAMLHFSRRVA